MIFPSYFHLPLAPSSLDWTLQEVESLPQSRERSEWLISFLTQQGTPKRRARESIIDMARPESTLWAELLADLNQLADAGVLVALPRTDLHAAFCTCDHFLYIYSCRHPPTTHTQAHTLKIWPSCCECHTQTFTRFVRMITFFITCGHADTHTTHMYLHSYLQFHFMCGLF